MWKRIDWIILAAVTAVAAALRFYQLGDLPPGFQFDEAFNAIDAQQVLAGNFPLFLPANGGREVLYTYWQAALGALFGLNVYTLRLASALAGTLTVPATYVTLRMMLRQDRRGVAAFTALVLAVSLWHVQFSRYGIRVITMPLILCGVFGLFWLGGHASTRTKRTLAYVLSGVLVGITPWTHPTGRFVPFILLFYVVWLMLRVPAERRWGRDSLAAGLLITGATAFVVFLPLGLEFVRHPEFFFGHASEVSVFADRVSGGSPTAHFLDNVLHVVGMFSFYGDLDWTHNLAGRPVFDWFMALPFYGGFVLLVWRLTQPDDEDFAALSLLTLWALVMLLPTLLSEAAPNYSRALPALPALFVPAGLGLTWLAGRRAPVRWLGPAAVAVILVASAASTVRDYFGRFAADAAVYYTYDADKLDALNYLAGLTDENKVYLSQLWGERHATVYYLRGRAGIESFDAADTLVLPPPGLGAVYGFPSEQHERAEQIQALWPDATLTDLTDPYGNHLITVVQVPAASAAVWPASLTPTATTQASWLDAPTLLGLRDEGDGTLRLFWRSDAPTYRDLTTFVHLIDQDGARIGQVDKLPGNGSFRTPYWTPGERVIDTYVPAVTDPCAGGEEARVVVGWYQYLADNMRMPRTDAPGDTALAGTMTVPPRAYSRAELTPPNVLDAPVADGLTLAGFDSAAAAWEPAARLRLDLYWQRDPRQAGTDDWSGIELALRQGETLIPLADGVIAPDGQWDDGEVLCRRVRTSLPADIAPSTYDLVVVDRGADGMGAPVPLTAVEVEPSTRVFALPATTNPVAYSFGNADAGDGSGQVDLRGYDVVRTADALEVTLLWQAQVTPQIPYKVFVHLLNADGELVAQSDAEPAGGYTTTAWLPGEVVADTHRISLPPVAAEQPLTLAVGLYDPAGGARAVAVDDAGARQPDDAVRLGEVPAP
ncbi:MAG: phospholipid carrier-dependent glycosyltransferase [Caldilineaceae bacterium]